MKEEIRRMREVPPTAPAPVSAPAPASAAQDIPEINQIQNFLKKEDKTYFETNLTLGTTLTLAQAAKYSVPPRSYA